jgi:uncharacterized membrane protein
MALYVVFVLSVVLITAVIASRGSILDTAKLAVTHQPETFTELYFVDPAKLPTFAIPGKKQTVQFHIQSHLPERHTYQYRITITGLYDTTTSTGTTTVSAGEGSTIPFSFTITQPGAQATITVSLVGTQQYLTLRSQS